MATTLIANHPMEGDFVVDVSEGVILAVATIKERGDIKKAKPDKKDKALIAHLNASRSVLTLLPLDARDDDDEEPAADDATGQPS